MRIHFAARALLMAHLTDVAHAGSATLHLTGTFANGAALGGTLTVDQTAGSFTAVNISIGPPNSGTYTEIRSQGPVGGYYLFVFPSGATAAYPALSLLLIAQNLVGYTGGFLCSTQAPCSQLASGLWAAAGNPVPLTAGNVSPTAPPTIPAVSPLALGGLAVLLALAAGLLLRPKDAF